MVAYRLAIDLGSSNTVAVLARAGDTPRPLLFDGAELLPSAVFAQADGDLITGRDAERFAVQSPGAFEPHPKRRVDDGVLLLGPHQIDVRDALAAILSRVRSQAGDAVGTVLTCPTGWGAPRRRILTEAAARADLGPVQLVSEAVAAAAYFAGTLAPHPPGTALAVVDIGGGTTDVAVVRDDLVVIAQGGTDIGGADIDAALVTHLLGATAGNGSQAGTAADRLLCRQEVRAAKESLSRTSHTPLRLPGRPTAAHLTRAELEEVATPILAEVGDLAARVIADAGLVPDQLAGVFLVGGGSRIPLAASILHTRLGVAPITVERPETVVVEGALIAVPAVSAPPAAPPVTQAPSSAATPARAGGTPAPPPRGRRRGRGLARPVLLAAALLCFALPFATVSCGVPGGYGRASDGGTTTYRGTTLITGTAPEVSARHLVPSARPGSDRLPPQLPLVGAVLAVLAALAVAVHARRGAPGAALWRLVLAGAVLLVVGELITLRLLAGRVQAGGTVSARDAGDYVDTASGFWLALTLLAAVLVVELRGRLRRLSGRTGPGPTPAPRPGR